MRLTLMIGAAAALALPASAFAQDAAQQPSPPAAEQTEAGATPDASTATAAAASDVVANAAVFDQSGASVGTIESVDATGAVLSTGSVKVKVPVTSFAKNDKGLVIGMTKAQIEAAAKKAG